MDKICLGKKYQEARIVRELGTLCIKKVKRCKSEKTKCIINQIRKI